MQNPSPFCRTRLVALFLILTAPVYGATGPRSTETVWPVHGVIAEPFTLTAADHHAVAADFEVVHGRLDVRDIEAIRSINRHVQIVQDPPAVEVALNHDDPAQWRARIMALARAAQTAMPLVGWIVHDEVTDRDHVEAFGYASFLLAVEPGSPLQLGLSATYVRDDGQRVVHLHPRYKIDLGQPVDSYPFDAFDRYRVDASVYVRRFEQGIVLVNPTATASVLTLDEEYVTPDLREPVRTAELAPRTGLILRRAESHAAQGEWRSLFNGRDLSGWRDITGEPVVGWTAGDGILTTAAGGGTKWLATEEEFDDFELHLEFRVPSRGNSAVVVRSPLRTPAVSGITIQVLDDHHPSFSGRLRPTQFAGSLYGILPPRVRATRPSGFWQTMRIRAIDAAMQVEINGVGVQDFDLVEVAELDERGGLRRRSGHIILQEHGNHVEYRNIRLRHLTKE